MAALEFRHITKHFYGIRALDDVSFGVDPGEIHALCGANGAGKSTLMKILAGVLQPDQGKILLNGQRVCIPHPSAARTLRIDIVFQEIELPPNLTVAEAVFLAREPRRRGMVDYQSMISETAALLSRLCVPIRPITLVADLSVAERQLVQITRALAGDTRVLILDEPTSALTDHEAERLFRLLESLRKQGATLLYVSHKLEEIFRLAQRVTVLRDGRVAGTRAIDRLTAEELVRMMVGSNGEDAALDPQAAPPAAPAAEARSRGEVALEVRSLTRVGVFREVSFQLCRGEVLGLFGIVGAGRTEIARCLFGLDRYDAGQVLLRGRPVRFRSPAEAVSAGLALVPEDRKLQGLVLEMSLERNASLPSLPRLTRAGFLRPAQERLLAASVVREMQVVTGSLEQEVRQLSGGNQQKVVIGKWLATRPAVLILDEPTRGIDITTKREVHHMIRRLAGQGMAVLLISSELGEVLSLSDRLLILHEGRVTARLDPQMVTGEQVMRAAVM